MRVLLDTSVWWPYMARGPLRPALQSFLEKSVTEFLLCPLSVWEIERKITLGKAVAPVDADWRNAVTRGFRWVHLGAESARVAAGWPWEHKDPVDRMLAAIARSEGAPLVHTDTKLKKLSGFPQRYFRAAEIQ